MMPRRVWRYHRIIRIFKSKKTRQHNGPTICCGLPVNHFVQLHIVTVLVLHCGVRYDIHVKRWSFRLCLNSFCHMFMFFCAYWYPTRFQMMLVSFNNSAARTAYPSGANMLLMDCPPLLAERSTSYTCIWSINISQLIRCSRGCAFYHDFLDEGLLVTRKFSIQEFLVVEGITS
jgi:hypothetical protein